MKDEGKKMEDKVEKIEGDVSEDMMDGVRDEELRIEMNVMRKK